MLLRPSKLAAELLRTNLARSLLRSHIARHRRILLVLHLELLLNGRGVTRIGCVLSGGHLLLELGLEEAGVEGSSHRAAAIVFIVKILMQIIHLARLLLLSLVTCLSGWGKQTDYLHNI